MASRPISLEIGDGARSRAQSMFDTGYGFHEAALRCTEERSLPEDPDLLCAPIAPLIANMALAAELYLKAMILAGGRNPPHGHRLNVLWMQLATSMRTDIATAFRDRIVLSEQELTHELQKLGAAFVDWRYIFDAHGQQISVSVLVEFARTLFLSIRSRHPDWAVARYVEQRISEDIRSYPLHVVCGRGGALAIVQGTQGAPAAK